MGLPEQESQPLLPSAWSCVGGKMEGPTLGPQLSLTAPPTLKPEGTFAAPGRPGWVMGLSLLPTSVSFRYEMQS